MLSDRPAALPSQPRLRVDVEKHWGDFRLTARLTAGSEVLVLFGPSGAGKTTCLNAIAGLLTPDAGEIALDGETLFRKDRPGPSANLPARRRRVGYVFQQYALFPHLTAVENAAYALQGERDGRQAALKLLEQMGIGHVAHRYPHEMSGGQQQRVAIARSLAANPRVLLLDEPFSALDAAVRQRLQGDLAALQADLGLIMLYVTHRLDDALALGQRLAVIRDGEVKQVGPIEDVFRYPANPEVAETMGIRNLFRANVIDATTERLLLDWDGLHLEAPPQPVEVGSAVVAYIQPEDVKILYPDRPAMSAVHHNRVSGVIQSSELGLGARALRVGLPNGHSVEVRFRIYTYAPLRLEAGQPVEVSLRREALVILHH
jgi:molybdate transport system ATP-binding protein